MDVTPLSMSLVPTEAPASRPVTRSLTPLTVVPSCMVPPEVIEKDRRRLVTASGAGAERPIHVQSPSGDSSARQRTDLVYVIHEIRFQVGCAQRTSGEHQRRRA